MVQDCPSEYYKTIHVENTLLFRIKFPVIDCETDCDVIFPTKIVCALTQVIEHIEKNFQVVTYSTMCIGHM